MSRKSARQAAQHPVKIGNWSRKAAVIAALAGGVALAPLAAPAQSYRFTDVQIVGSQRIEPATILTYAGISRGEVLDAGQVNDALQRLQNSGLFDAVAITPKGNTLVITVAENPTINVISFEGNSRLKDAQLAELVKSSPRRVYSASQAEADAAAIADLYAVQGRLAATVTPRVIIRDGNRVDLAFEITEGKVVENERISFTGNRAYSDRRLRQVLQTKQAGLLRSFIKRDTLITERLDLDRQLLADFYRSRGYVDFKVRAVAPELTRDRSATFITFEVEEGQQYRFANVDAVSEISGVAVDEFLSELRAKPGAIYSPEAIDVTVTRMETLAQRKGLNFVAVEPRVSRDPRAGTLDVTFALVRGPRVFVERIDIEGNTATLDSVIRREFRIVEGDPLNQREIRRAAERVRALGYFAQANVSSREGKGGDQVIVDVDVEEQPTGSLSFGASYGAESGIGFNAGITEKNFLGRGQELNVSISTASSDSDSSISFVEPYFLDRDLRAGFSAWYKTSESDDYADYSTRSVGLSPTLEFPVSERGRVTLRYRLSKDTLYDITAITTDTDDEDDDGDTTDLIGSSPILVREEGSRVSSSVGYSYSWDTKREEIDPRNRFMLRFTQDFAGLGGDVKSVTTSALALAETKVWGEEITLRAELEAGAVHMLDDQTSTITQRYLGYGKVRGFQSGGYGPRDLNAPNEDALGGNYFWALRLETEFPIGLPEEYGIHGGAFADVGSVWGLDDTAGYNGTVDDDMHVRASVGLSLFWDTPVGPLRINYARAVKKEDYDEEQRFELTVSTSF